MENIVEVNSNMIYLTQYGEDKQVNLLLAYRLKDIIGFEITDSQAIMIVQQESSETTGVDIKEWRELIIKYIISTKGKVFSFSTAK